MLKKAYPHLAKCDNLTRLNHPTLPKARKDLPCAREQDFGLPSPWFGKMLVALAPSGKRKTSADSRKKEFQLHPHRRRREPAGSHH